MNSFSIRSLNRALGVVCLVLLAGCAGKPASQGARTAMTETQLVDPNQALNDFANRLQSAQVIQVDLFSPQYFEKAKNSYNDAKRARSESKEAYDPEIMKKLNEAQAYLDKALKTSEISKASLAQAQDARDRAIAAGATRFFPKDFKDADKDFLSITEKIENGDLSRANKEGPKLAATYNNLEKRSVKEKYVAESARAIEAAKNEGADKWAPKTLTDAQNELNRLDAAIMRDPRDVATIEPLADSARKEADFLLKLTRESKLMETMKPEQRALEMEKFKNEVASLQSEATQNKEQQVASAQELQKTQKQLEDVNRLQSLAKAFTPEEADVLRQGDRLVIHLKALDFPNAKAHIPSSDYTVLNKLGEVLAQAGPDAKVTVEGNTDSVGSRSSNMKLSEKRAEAVKDYLVANKSIPSEKIEAKGMGFSKPIASNKTAEGRRLNRRVDVIIQEVAAS